MDYLNLLKSVFILRKYIEFLSCNSDLTKRTQNIVSKTMVWPKCLCFPLRFYGKSLVNFLANSIHRFPAGFLIRVMNVEKKM